MTLLESYLGGKWVGGKGKEATLVNPATEEPIARCSTEGLELGEPCPTRVTAGGQRSGR